MRRKRERRPWKPALLVTGIRAAGSALGRISIATRDPRSFRRRIVSVIVTVSLFEPIAAGACVPRAITSREAGDKENEHAFRSPRARFSRCAIHRSPLRKSHRDLPPTLSSPSGRSAVASASAVLGLSSSIRSTSNESANTDGSSNNDGKHSRAAYSLSLCIFVSVVK